MLHAASTGLTRKIAFFILIAPAIFIAGWLISNSGSLVETKPVDHAIAAELVVINAPPGFHQKVQPLGFEIESTEVLKELNITATLVIAPKDVSVWRAKGMLIELYPTLVVELNSGDEGFESATGKVSSIIAH